MWFHFRFVLEQGHKQYLIIVMIPKLRNSFGIYFLAIMFGLNTNSLIVWIASYFKLTQGIWREAGSEKTSLRIRVIFPFFTAQVLRSTEMPSPPGSNLISPNSIHYFLFSVFQHFDHALHITSAHCSCIMVTCPSPFFSQCWKEPWFTHLWAFPSPIYIHHEVLHTIGVQ